MTAQHAVLHGRARARALARAVCPADNTWAFSSLAQRLSTQWKEAVNTSFFGTVSIDGEGASPAHAREHGAAPDHAAAAHPPHHSSTNPAIHQGPFMEDSLRALRRGLLAQLEVQHTAQRSTSDDKATLSDENGSIGGGGNFSLMLDMGYELSENDGVPAGVGDEDAASAAASTPAAGSGGSRPVQFVAHDPLVFACLRHSLNIPDNEYREAFLDVGFEALKPATSKSGRSFYMTKDHRFILKSLSRAEADFLLEVLCQYFEHVAKHPSTLLPRFCGLYEVSEKGRDVLICVEANFFSSQCPIHERYDLKGSVVGRMTRQEDKAKDANVILKDLDLTRQLPLGLACRSLLLMQLKSDCQFLESLEIVDYSLLLGVHNPHRLHHDIRGESQGGDGDMLSHGAGEGGGGRASECDVQDVWHALPAKGSGAGGEPRERRDSMGDGSFGTGKKAHWTPALEPSLPDDHAVATFENFKWKHVEMLESADFDAQITFNPNKVRLFAAFLRKRNGACPCGVQLCGMPPCACVPYLLVPYCVCSAVSFFAPRPSPWSPSGADIGSRVCV